MLPPLGYRLPGAPQGLSREELIDLFDVTWSELLASLREYVWLRTEHRGLNRSATALLDALQAAHAARDHAAARADALQASLDAAEARLAEAEARLAAPRAATRGPDR